VLGMQKACKCCMESESVRQCQEQKLYFAAQSPSPTSLPTLLPQEEGHIANSAVAHATQGGEEEEGGNVWVTEEVQDAGPHAEVWWGPGWPLGSGWGSRGGNGMDGHDAAGK
jgi:hypothetical protein